MTEQEAIDVINNECEKSFLLLNCSNKFAESLTKSIGALEKQIPKEPRYDGDGYAPDGSFVWDEWLCPRCNSRFEIDYDEYNYCPNCGQAIKWE